jgi:cell division protein FtsQ
MLTMKKLKKILLVSLWTALFLGFITLVGFTYMEHNDQSCKAYHIRIDYGNADTLLTQADVYDLIKRTGNILKGQHLGSIDAEMIERELRHQPYVAHAEVFVTLDGIAEIQVLQRQPILRIFNRSGESFYLDGLGHLLPLNPSFSARVMVATGFIDEQFSKKVNYLQDSVRRKDSAEYRSVMINLFSLSTYIMKNRFLRAQIEQIYVDEMGEFQLIPRVGNHIIIFGTPEDIESKFDRLYAFYKYGLSRTGWKRYNVINIKFRNQVVCSKI